MDILLCTELNNHFILCEKAKCGNSNSPNDSEPYLHIYYHMLVVFIQFRVLKKKKVYVPFDIFHEIL